MVAEQAEEGTFLYWIRKKSD
ncbi:hypothetical protein A245_25993 [Pseudomonas syringae pv. actinidiae ICMP 19096]|uniref:Uncharacterized protein n=1 Tax=Pseudomonas syringae pv. actinidiae ICMP 19096 TaxID=1194405 RepID=A0A656JTF2_PSESF|nr:hypothetical protein A245_25993 [Pseudomonas syringae pv. actinidiae ICMP 19096]